MIWLNAAAAIGLAALAAPILIHVLARHRAPRQPFPTLRFINPHPLAAVRRHLVEDFVLLAVRLLVLAAAVAAAAGPFIISASRMRAWEARTIRADVQGDVRQEVIRAVAWLERQPPARREIVIRAPLSIGSVTAADIAAVPAHIGLRFERTPLPSAATVRGAPVVANGVVVDRDIQLDAGQTRVREHATSRQVTPPIELVAPAPQNSAATMLSERLAAERYPAPVASRSARLIFGEPPSLAPLRSAWMADAAAQIARDAPVPVRFGAEGNRLIVAAAIRADQPDALPLVRTIVRVLAPPAAHPADEILPIPDAQLRAWTRDPGAAVLPPAATIDRDDRRWLWGLALVLLGIESWVRRSRTRSRASDRTEQLRVA